MKKIVGLLGALGLCLIVPPASFAVNYEPNEDGVIVTELTFHSAPEPRPALKYRLTTDEFDQVDRNAAIYYLKAMGFLEQGQGVKYLIELKEKWEKEDCGSGKADEVPRPYCWMSMPLEKLPLEEIKEFLSWYGCQPRYLREAVRCRHCDFGHRPKETENPVSILLPEIQSLRELVRVQVIRARVALAERRYDDAIEIIRQSYMLAKHLGQGQDFVVSNLIGIAIAGITWDATKDLIQQPDSPNLYWAIASMPKPLVDMRRSLGFESNLIYLQLPFFKEVDETPRPAEYWNELRARNFGRDAWGLDTFGIWRFSDNPSRNEVATTAYVIAAYPGARKYLIERCGMSETQVESYPALQLVALATTRVWDELTDDCRKWSYLPFWQAVKKQREMEDKMRKQLPQIGPVAILPLLLIPAISSSQQALVRSEQELALLQTVEAIRHYGSKHDSKLPASLDDLDLPAPIDPATGKPFIYEVDGEQATLKTSHKLNRAVRHLILRFAKPKQP